MTITYHVDQLPEIASQLVGAFTHKTLLFYGEMGAGKTTFIKELARQLDFTNLVNSPTFSLVNEYENATGKLYHFDFYRINHPTEAMDMGIEEYLYADAWVMIEWPEKINSLLPEKFHKIVLEKNGLQTRTLTLS
jgi:tRNA threonylcarbamoyladenosine biosynthesis protein TsaE